MDLTKKQLTEKLGEYLAGRISLEDLALMIDYSSSESKEWEKLAEYARTSILHAQDEDDRYRTPRTVLEYLLACLKGNEVFSQKEVDKLSGEHYDKFK